MDFANFYLFAGVYMTFLDDFPAASLPIIVQALQLGLKGFPILGPFKKAYSPSKMVNYIELPSGELTFCHGKSPFLMGKSTISMAIFHCYVSSPEGTTFKCLSCHYHCVITIVSLLTIAYVLVDFFASTTSVNFYRKNNSSLATIPCGWHHRGITDPT